MGIKVKIPKSRGAMAPFGPLSSVIVRQIVDESRVGFVQDIHSGN